MPKTDSTMTVKVYRTLQEALDEVERELNVRSRCFGRWVEEGRVSRTDAQDRLDRLSTAYVWLNKVSEAEDSASLADVTAEVQAVTNPDAGENAKPEPVAVTTTTETPF